MKEIIVRLAQQIWQNTDRSVLRIFIVVCMIPLAVLTVVLLAIMVAMLIAAVMEPFIK